MSDNQEKKEESIQTAKGENKAKRSGVLNLPNKLTISRMVMIPFFVLFFYLKFPGHYFVALAVYIIASFTDLLDGMIARKRNLVTNLGKFLDPIADKVLVATAFIVFLTVPAVFTANGHLGTWTIIVAGCGVAIILAREIIVSGLRTVAASDGIVIAADMFGKYKTVFQDICVAILLASLGFSELMDNLFCQIVNYLGLVAFAISIILTLLSGINYIIKNIEVLKK